LVCTSVHCLGSVEQVTFDIVSPSPEAMRDGPDLSEQPGSNQSNCAAGTAPWWPRWLAWTSGGLDQTLHRCRERPSPPTTRSPPLAKGFRDTQPKMPIPHQPTSEGFTRFGRSGVYTRSIGSSCRVRIPTSAARPRDATDQPSTPTAAGSLPCGLPWRHTMWQARHKPVRSVHSPPPLRKDKPRGESDALGQRRPPTGRRPKRASRSHRTLQCQPATCRGPSRRPRLPNDGPAGLASHPSCTLICIMRGHWVAVAFSAAPTCLRDGRALGVRDRESASFSASVDGRTHLSALWTGMFAARTAVRGAPGE
jgi:hypothetical protein